MFRSVFSHVAIRAMSSSRRGKFAVLVTGQPPEDIQTQYGDYGYMLTNLLRDSPDEQWVSYNVMDYEFPSEEELKEIDVIVLSGSKFDAHADTPWIHKLKTLIVGCSQDQSKKILGICFGHQLTAIALGGQSGRADCGWELGVKKLSVTPTFKRKFGQFEMDHLKVLEVHQDQVKVLPEGAELLASSEHTPIEMFAIGDNILCLQGHPEFNEDIVTKLVVSRAEAGVVPKETAQLAIESLKQGTDNSSLQILLKCFLKRKQIQVNL